MTLMHYTYIVQETLCLAVKITVIQKPYDKTQIQTFERNVLEDKFFGFAQVDIEVPHNLKDKSSEMPPLFVVDEIPDNCIPEEMQLYKKRKKSFWELQRPKRFCCIHHFLNRT